MALQPGTMLHGGSYRIIRFIGQGGFGCTYEIEHVTMGRRMAMKEFFVASMCNRDATGYVSAGITTQVALVDKLRQKFINEARSVNALNHHGIVRVTDVFEENGTAYFVMDYIDGQSLQSIIDKFGPMPVAHAVAYIQQVCDAIEYVHNKHMLHLDIKPDNIMVDSDGRAILIDFGVSKQYDEENGQNTSTIVGHSMGYSPLEQASNKLRNFTPATDIYAIGATLYALLTGHAPIDSSELAMGEKLPPLPSNVSQAVSNAIYKAMQPSPVNRPQSIAEFRQLLLADLNATQIHLAPQTKTNPTTIIQTTATNKRWWIKYAAAAALIAIIASLAIIFWPKGNGGAEDVDLLPLADSVCSDTITALVEGDKPDETPAVSAEIQPQAPVASSPSQPASIQTPVQNNTAPENNAVSNVPNTIPNSTVPDPLPEPSSSPTTSNQEIWN